MKKLNFLFITSTGAGLIALTLWTISFFFNINLLYPAGFNVIQFLFLFLMIRHNKRNKVNFTITNK